MARSLFSGLFRYGETEVDPVIQAEILLESARSEARASILILLMGVGFALWYQFEGPIVSATSLFAVASVVFLLGDAQLRRSAAKRLRGKGPQLPPRPRMPQQR